MKKFILNGFVALTSLFATINAFSQAFTENFDNITTLTGNGWYMQNNGSTMGTIPSWIQGNADNFPSFNGATNSYIGGHFNTITGTGTISLWLVTPSRTYKNGDVFQFYARASDDGWADRLQVRLSTNAASTNVGAGPTAVGDFTNLLLDINPTYANGVFTDAWTQHTITISGLSAPTVGRIAFRYFVESGGPDGVRSDYIGIDNVVYTPYVCPTFTMTAGGPLSDGTAGTAYSTTLTQSGALGTPNFAVTAGVFPPGLTLSTNGTISGTPTASGTFNFTITVNDASGCTGTQSYSITTVCPANPITFTAPTLCENEPIYTLVEATPAGGTYSGTGVTSGQFDPSAGTQAITYNYTDPYGCSHQASSTITVNSLPTVTLPPIDPVCESVEFVALEGGTPLEGTYSGIGVTGIYFETSNGTQAITYSYTDANGCTNEATSTITVNENPSVTLNLATTALCTYSSPLNLTGGAPAGGTYTGNGVSGAIFTPSTSVIGNQTITYAVTENGCTGNATATINVDACASINETEVNDFRVYPNPSSGMISIELNNTFIEGVTIEVINLDGKVMLTQEIINTNKLNTLSLAHLAKGTYILQVRNSNLLQIQRIVLK